jgi:Tfp pilus assembly protein PilN
MARRINLVPPSERARTTTNVAALGLVVTAMVVICALGLGYLLLHNSLSDRKQELADVEQQTSGLQAQVASLAQYGELADARNATEQRVQGIYAGRTLVSDILDAMSLVVPENVWFESLGLTASDPSPANHGAVAGPTQEDNKMSLIGNTYSFEDVAQLLVRLQLVPGLYGIDLGSAGAPMGTVDTSKDVKGFSVGASTKNEQDADTPLPMSQVEVEGL